MAEMGLRERKKAETRRAIWHTAMEAFLERGFEETSVAEIALAANISKMTFFNYFGSKEDLVLGPAEDHVGDDAAVAAQSPEPLRALRDLHLSRVDGRDPAVGMCDIPSVLGVFRLVSESPALMARFQLGQHRREQLLAEALGGDEAARLMAALVSATLRHLTGENVGELLTGASADDVAARARERATTAFDRLDIAFARS
ncbi:TetR family transcriptional regulator [Actinomadura parmotrematis]|uniref:TetR/AcrR family transcriptional regulator n=1 Tax=Actinomadura parmotrematis TaxID=2864039 RepID=A0ABS7FSR6_9ACTN|nr:TetR family transcriptional regulator [Actinomadura parmotrematis]MBW8483464.1 TetR/AcrR family transcriptional regulator [Actinomadura parmotrematis]